MPKLFENDSSSDEAAPGGLQVNKSFAEAYERRKQRQELLNAPRDLDLLSSSSGSEEDDAAVELTDTVDVKIHETLRMIKEKDPRIYDPNFNPFGDGSREDVPRPPERAAKSSKPLKYKDMVRIRAEQGAEAEEEEEGAPSSGYVADQALEKQKFVQALLRVGEEEDGDGDFLVPKGKPLPVAHEQPAANASSGPMSRPELFQPPADSRDENEAFLWKYLRERAWMTGDEDDHQQQQQPWMPQLQDERDDEEEVDRAEQFEAAYNFRFEEPGADQVTTHARAIEGSLRRMDDSRKQQRQRKKERKEEKKQKQLEELKRLKNLRRKLLEQELEKSFKAGGVRKSGLLPEDIDEDFDPDTWDQKMAQVYNDDYYAEEDEEFALVDDAEAGEEEVRGGGSGSGSARGGRVAEDMEEPSHSGLDAAAAAKLAADEDDALDVAPGGFRFKYRPVAANSFGLTDEEILIADPSTLNQFVSLSRIAPYREKEWHAAPKHRYKFREALKQKLADIHATPKASVKRRRKQKAIMDPRKVLAAAKNVKSSRLASYQV